MKYCVEKYPLGSLGKRQKTAGRYINDILYDNLKVLAKKIADDMTFLGVCFSSTFEVGTGKSVFMQQIGEAWTELVNQYHGVNIDFTINNIVFRPKDLIERSFELPKYSCIVLDEWEDAHYWSELAMTLRQFFRKCRQLNLFILIIIPNFFELPKTYAISRSVFAIDVKFLGNFERGYFDFYNFDSKKWLYVQGKKNYDYKVQRADFNGSFLKGYTVGDEVYKKAKYEDMMKYDEEQKSPISLLKEYRKKILINLKEVFPKASKKDYSKVLEVSPRTIGRDLKEIKEISIGNVGKDDRQRAVTLPNAS